MMHHSGISCRGNALSHPPLSCSGLTGASSIPEESRFEHHGLWKTWSPGPHIEPGDDTEMLTSEFVVRRQVSQSEIPADGHPLT